mgnify:FL=1
MLLYFIPLVAIGYDLYIRAADLSIKKMGAFLRSHPKAGTTDVEKAWEKFSAKNRDKLAHLATSLFTSILIVASAAYIYVQKGSDKATLFYVGYAIWLGLSLLFNGLLWKSHRDQIRKLDKYKK